MEEGRPKLLTDWELWACALSLERRHGESALPVIADRISKLAMAGDFDGVANWKIIAARFDQLQEAAWV
jgi:hypothetical protein